MSQSADGELGDVHSVVVPEPVLSKTSHPEGQPPEQQSSDGKEAPPAVVGAKLRAGLKEKPKHESELVADAMGMRTHWLPN